MNIFFINADTCISKGSQILYYILTYTYESDFRNNLFRKPNFTMRKLRFQEGTQLQFLFPLVYGKARLEPPAQCSFCHETMCMQLYGDMDTKIQLCTCNSKLIRNK